VPGTAQALHWVPWRLLAVHWVRVIDGKLASDGEGEFVGPRHYGCFRLVSFGFIVAQMFDGVKGGGGKSPGLWGAGGVMGNDRVQPRGGCGVAPSRANLVVRVSPSPAGGEAASLATDVGRLR